MRTWRPYSSQFHGFSIFRVAFDVNKCLEKFKFPAFTSFAHNCTMLSESHRDRETERQRDSFFAVSSFCFLLPVIVSPCFLPPYMDLFLFQSLTFFAATAALKTTRGSPYVRLNVRPSVSFTFFAIYSKNLQATHTLKFVTLCYIFCGCP